MVVEEGFAIYTFGFLLWELISGQPQPKHGEGLNHLVLFLESILHFLFTQLIVQLLAI